jgi:SWI/SNF-related matrix-associated actin-dependent regulator of chromatin subfamily C
MFSGDFVRLVSASEFKHVDGIHADDWTDAEILLLLEGIEMFEDDWGAVSEHVGTRTKEQCVAQFLQLPIEDEYTSPPSQGDLGPLQYARIPFEKADNPVMSVVAFLAGAVGPGVAAAAAQAGMAELTDSLKRKAAKKAEERGKTEGNEVSTVEKHESEELQSSTLDESKDSFSASHKSSSAHARSAVERAAALALSSASVKAQALASHEEEHIRALTSKIVTAQRTKLELKLEQFEAMEELVEEERRRLEEARLALFREKNNLTTQLHELKNLALQQRQMGGGIPPGFETQFTMLAQSDIPHAHEVSMRGLEYLQGANISHLH